MQKLEAPIRSRARSGGFTLVELLVVITIIAILVVGTVMRRFRQPHVIAYQAAIGVIALTLIGLPALGLAGVVAGQSAGVAGAAARRLRHEPARLRPRDLRGTGPGTGGGTRGIALAV